jgi:ABC-type multidrug transport system fused ATPase/permease subunit
MTASADACTPLLQLLDSVFAATYRWLNTTPQGRLVSRFTSSFSTIDGQVIETTYMLLDIVVLILVRLIAIAAVAPVAGLVGLAVGVLGALIAQVFIHLNLYVCPIHPSP